MHSIDWMTIAIAAIGVAISVISASFIAGSRWGALAAEVAAIKGQLAEISRMFELKLRNDARARRGH